MSLIKVLFISVFIFFIPSGKAESVSSEQCDKLKLESSITLIEGIGARVEIEAKGGKAPYKYIFYRESGHLVSTKYDNNWVDGLQKGKYSCTVADKDNCKKTVDFEIK